MSDALFLNVSTASPQKDVLLFSEYPSKKSILNNIQALNRIITKKVYLQRTIHYVVTYRPIIIKTQLSFL